MRIGIIAERKSPPDRRVALTPVDCKKLMITYPELDICVEPSAIRVFSDDAYREQGVKVTKDLSDCDVLLGVKEVPEKHLIPQKKYIFFSHTIKQQPYNRNLLRKIIDLNIELYDHETFTDSNGIRLVAFGYYAGLVGAYNGLRAYGLKTQKFSLPKASDLPDAASLKAQLAHLPLKQTKVVVTGKGRVGAGVREILLAAGLAEVSAKSFLDESFDKAVFAHIDVLKYNKRRDGQPGSKSEFYKNPELYEANFLRYARAADLYIAGHFYGNGAPVFFNLADIRDKTFKLSVIADISCDIHIPIPTTLRASTIAEPIYGVDRNTGKETDFTKPDAIAVMAVDNLPCELPKDASEGFSKQFVERIIPAFFDGDADGILERARITQDGELTKRYQYLKTYVS
ncbi:MAG: NAD(P)-dependent oxidoreductase [Flavobacteriaceae bacterium]|nr:NAD(P)-dependent oxidoreductase [Flavobacteriaceae bacterium]